MLRRTSLLCAVLLGAGCDTDVPIQDGRPTEPGPGSEQEAFRSADQVLQNLCDSDAVGFYPHRAAPVLTGDSAHSNEVHDCQKLVVMEEGQPAFGPLVAIWPIADAAHADTTDFVGGLNVATVVNHGSEGYAPLGLLDRAIHCLRLTYDSAAGTYSAVMFVPANESEFCLNNQPPETDDTTNLEVKVADRWPDGALQPAATARIGWSSPPDSQSLSSVAGTPRPEHYLGVRCAGEWCGVGPAGFAFATTQRAGTGPAVTPGYYDEQFIAVPVAPGQTALKPGPWAVIQPTNDLHQQDTTSWMGGKRVVAHVMIDRGSGSDPEDHILKKLGFRPTGLGGGPSQAPNAILLQFHGKDHLDSDGNPAPFSAEHRSPAGNPFASKLKFVPHRAHGVKGSVRWRWNADDETGWIYCDLGCCESGGAY